MPLLGNINDFPPMVYPGINTGSNTRTHVAASEGVGGGVYWGSEGGREAPGKTCGGGAGEACGAFQDVSGSVYLVCSRGTRF